MVAILGVEIIPGLEALKVWHNRYLGENPSSPLTIPNNLKIIRLKVPLEYMPACLN